MTGKAMSFYLVLISKFSSRTPDVKTAEERDNPNEGIPEQ